jgi:hypothetical protein
MRFRTHQLLLLAFLLVGLATTACRPMDPPIAESDVTPGPTSTDGTPAPLPEGLQKILDDVATVRGLPAPPTLDAKLIARSELPALLSSLMTDDDRKWFAETTTLYRLLGHFRQDQDYETVYNGFGAGDILGLYSPGDAKLWVVHDDGKSIDFDNLPRQEHLTLAHEFTHAVQDYNFKLKDTTKTVADDLDRSLAYTSVVEGDAVVNEGAYGGKYLTLPSGGRLFALGGYPTYADTPPSISRELLFPYTTGADWVRSLKDKSGTKAIDALLANPPSATAVILHPDLLTNGWKPAEIKLPDLESRLGSDWKRESGGTFGEFQVRNYLQLRVGASTANNASSGWDGDHYDVYVDGKGASVAAFRIRFKDAKEANEFVSAQDQLLNAIKAKSRTESGLTIVESTQGPVTARAAVQGADVVFAIGSNADVAIKTAQAIASN